MEYRAMYGGSNIPCTIYTDNGWYVIEGSKNVNYTNDTMYNGIDLELVTDTDSFQADDFVMSQEDLENEVNSLLYER